MVSRQRLTPAERLQVFEFLHSSKFLDRLPESVVIVSEDGRCLYANRMAVSYFRGRSRKHVLGQKIGKLVPASLGRILDEVRTRRFQSGNFGTEEVSLSFPRGECRHFFDTWFVVPTRRFGRVLVVIGRPVHRYAHIDCQRSAAVLAGQPPNKVVPFRSLPAMQRAKKTALGGNTRK